MKWMDCAVQDLNKYGDLKDSVGNLQERIKVLEEKFTQIKSSKLDGIAARGGNSSRDDFMTDNIVEREKLKFLCTHNKRMVLLIDRGLSRLNQEERMVIEYFYINRMKNHVEQLMERLNIEKTSIYRIKDQALYKFTMNMYGMIED